MAFIPIPSSWSHGPRSLKILEVPVRLKLQGFSKMRDTSIWDVYWKKNHLRFFKERKNRAWFLWQLFCAQYLGKKRVGKTSHSFLRACCPSSKEPSGGCYITNLNTACLQGKSLKTIIHSHDLIPKKYCWWKESCTNWYGKCPIIYRVFIINR